MCQNTKVILQVVRAVDVPQNPVSIIIKIRIRNTTITIGFCKTICKNLIKQLETREPLVASCFCTKIMK